jgi:hypothetical protein
MTPFQSFAGIANDTGVEPIFISMGSGNSAGIWGGVIVLVDRLITDNGPSGGSDLITSTLRRCFL